MKQILCWTMTWSCQVAETCWSPPRTEYGLCLTSHKKMRASELQPHTGGSANLNSPGRAAFWDPEEDAGTIANASDAATKQQWLVGTALGTWPPSTTPVTPAGRDRLCASSSVHATLYSSQQEPPPQQRQQPQLSIAPWLASFQKTQFPVCDTAKMGCLTPHGHWRLASFKFQHEIVQNKMSTY